MSFAPYATRAAPLVGRKSSPEIGCSGAGGGRHPVVRGPVGTGGLGAVSRAGGRVPNGRRGPGGRERESPGRTGCFGPDSVPRTRDRSRVSGPVSGRFAAPVGPLVGGRRRGARGLAPDRPAVTEISRIAASGTRSASAVDERVGRGTGTGRPTPGRPRPTRRTPARRCSGALWRGQRVADDARATRPAPARRRSAPACRAGAGSRASASPTGRGSSANDPAVLDPQPRRGLDPLGQHAGGRHAASGSRAGARRARPARCGSSSLNTSSSSSSGSAPDDVGDQAVPREAQRERERALLALRRVMRARRARRARTSSRRGADRRA